MLIPEETKSILISFPEDGQSPIVFLNADSDSGTRFLKKWIEGNIKEPERFTPGGFGDFPLLLG